MNDPLWILLIVLLVFFFVLVILPHIIPANPTVVHRPNARPPINEPENNPTAVPHEKTPQEWEEEEARMSRAMLDSQFQPVSDTVPVNYPKKPIGACPYAKPPSTALRLTDTPMCVSVQQHDMQMSALRCPAPTK